MHKDWMMCMSESALISATQAWNARKNLSFLLAIMQIIQGHDNDDD